jgi:hypothetical protein
MHQTFDEMTQEVLVKLNLPLDGYAFAIIRAGIRKAYAVGEKDGRLTQRAPDVCPVCLGKKLVQTKSRGVIKCASCNGTGQRR